jgi:hypothetical protein
MKVAKDEDRGTFQQLDLEFHLSRNESWPSCSATSAAHHDSKSHQVPAVGTLRQLEFNGLHGKELHAPIESVREPVQTIAAAIHQAAGGCEIVRSQRLTDPIFPVAQKSCQ